MRVFIRYGLNEVDLGDMPTLPLPEDRVAFDVPEGQRIAGERPYERLTVARRTFERRLSPARVRIDLPSEMQPVLKQISEWVCVLTTQEAR